MSIVKTSAKFRSKAMHRVEGTDQYEYGWESKGHTKAAGHTFSRVGSGDLDQALNWLSRSDDRSPARRAYREFDSL